MNPSRLQTNGKLMKAIASRLCFILFILFFVIWRCFYSIFFFFFKLRVAWHENRSSENCFLFCSQTRNHFQSQIALASILNLFHKNYIFAFAFVALLFSFKEKCRKIDMTPLENNITWAIRFLHCLSLLLSALKSADFFQLIQWNFTRKIFN